MNSDSSNGSGLWIFCCEFSRPDIAGKTIESVTGEKGKIDSEGMFVFGQSQALISNNKKNPIQPFP